MRRPGIALGDYIVDLSALASNAVFQSLCPAQFPFSTLQQSTMNDFAALGRKTVNAIRLLVKDLFLETTSMVRDDQKLRAAVVVNTREEGVEAQMHLPFDTRDFTDFLNSRVVSNFLVDRPIG
jgi:fumarylacetoacetase